MRSIVFFVLAVSCTRAFDATLNEEWKSWKSTNNKYYSFAEEKLRRTIWENNLQKVQEHNVQADLGVHSYWLGMNRFADLTVDEFVRLIRGDHVKVHRDSGKGGQIFTFDTNMNIPDTIDWRDKGCVSPVKNMSRAVDFSAIYSVTGVLEGARCAATGKLLALSNQNIIDCICRSGSSCSLEEISAGLTKLGGIESEDSYPDEIAPSKCRFDPAKIAVQWGGFVDVPSREEKALQQAVAMVGPISTSIDASHASFQLYRRGVYNEPQCSTTQRDLSVLVIGYGNGSGTDYWLVKNCWGTSWGDQGYIKMSRNRDNQCGIATSAWYPTV